jgi:hypothetical protein
LRSRKSRFRLVPLHSGARLMRLRLVCAALAAATFAYVGPSAAGAATGDELRAFLAFVPATPAPPRRISVDYFDLRVAAAITVKRGLEALTPMGRRANIPYFGHMLGRAAAWKRTAGFMLEEIDALGTAGFPPDTVHFFRLAPAVRLEALTAVWRARGFRETPSAAAPIWGRGEPRKMDVSKVDADDPFGGALGRSSFILPALPFLAEAFAPEPLIAAKQAQAAGGLAARPDVAALLAALDRGGGSLLQAMLLPEPADSMTADHAPIAYSALLFADVEYSDHAEAQLLLAFADCAAARAAETAIAQGWDTQHPAIRVYRPTWAAHKGAPCVLTGRVTAPGTAGARQFANPAYRILVDAWVRRDLTSLVIRAPR